MIKKRSMAATRQFYNTNNSILTRQQISDLAERWINDINVKRLETGYADNQPKWPYWVRPHNYNESEWQAMGGWMTDTFGNCNWHTETALWVGSDRKYWFRDEADRTLFLLKWS